MSMFYLLPSRSVLGDRLVDILAVFLPGASWDVAGREQLVEAVLEVLRDHTDVFVLWREDLPPGELAERALVDGYGAEAGDEVVEVRLTARPGEFASRRWQIRCGAESIFR